VCPTEIVAFSDAITRFQDTGCNVAAVSVDSKHTHLAFIQTPRNKGGLGKMQIPVISDITKAISKAYGMLVEDPSDEMAGVSLRGTVIIDGKGIVRHVSCNDAPVGRDVESYLTMVQAFQYTDKHGEVCPAGWKPGHKTMKADPKGSKEFFDAANK
jgi:alkyl hydroperoxide reductase subunit AhpC